MQGSFWLCFVSLSPRIQPQKELSLRPLLSEYFFSSKGEVKKWAEVLLGCVWPWLCVSAEGFTVSQWLLIYVEPRPVQETHCSLKALENCSLKALCLKAAPKGILPWEEQVIVELHGVVKLLLHRAGSSKLQFLDSGTQGTRAEIYGLYFLEPTC